MGEVGTKSQKGMLVAEMFVPSWSPVLVCIWGLGVQWCWGSCPMGWVLLDREAVGSSALGKWLFRLCGGRLPSRLNALISISVTPAGLRAKVCWSWTVEVQPLFSEVSLRCWEERNTTYCQFWGSDNTVMKWHLLKGISNASVTSYWRGRNRNPWL